MNKGKKTILIILGCILVFVTLLVIYFGSVEKNNNGNENSNNTSQENTKYFEKVNNYEKFFAIQNTLNNNSVNISYVITELFLNRIGTTKYYFINCSKFESDFGEETIEYTKNNYYLLIENNNNYMLNEINEEFNNLEFYAKNYQTKQIKIDNKNIISNSNINEPNLIAFYIEYFKKLLFLDTKLAYDMLSEQTKKLYTSYYDFDNQKINIYNKLSSKVFAYNKKEEKNIRIYYVEDDNRNKIELHENNIMDFKISY